MTRSLSRPGTSRLRVNVLRATFLACLPLVVFAQPVWSGTHWLFEVFEVAGFLLIIAGVLGRFWAILYIGGNKNHLVMQDGPYSTCRHPLYFFSTLGVLGFGFALGSFVVAAVLGGLTFAVLSVTASREEAWLREEFGPAYGDYAARVPRILPDPRRFRSDDRVTFSVAHLRRNLMDALVFLCFIPLAEILKMLKEYGVVPTFPIW